METTYEKFSDNELKIINVIPEKVEEEIKKVEDLLKSKDELTMKLEVTQRELQDRIAEVNAIVSPVIEKVQAELDEVNAMILEAEKLNIKAVAVEEII